jgi:hypothetical protein
MLGARSRSAGRICSTRRVRPRSVVHRRGVMRGSARCAVYAAGDRGEGVVPQIEANDAGRKSNARRRRSLVARGGGCGPRRPRSSVRMQYNSQCATRRRCPRCMQPALLSACTSSFCHRAASRLRAISSGSLRAVSRMTQTADLHTPPSRHVRPLGSGFSKPGSYLWADGVGPRIGVPTQ